MRLSLANAGLLFALLGVCAAQLRRDFKPMTDDDIDRVAAEWEDEEEKREREEQREQMMKKNPGDNGLMIVEVDVKDEKEGNALGARWQSMFTNMHLDVKIYAPDAGTVIAMNRVGKRAGEVIKFLLEQPEVKSVKSDDQMYYPKGKAPPGQKNAAGGNAANMGNIDPSILARLKNDPEYLKSIMAKAQGGPGGPGGADPTGQFKKPKGSRKGKGKKRPTSDDL